MGFSLSGLFSNQQIQNTNVSKGDTIVGASGASSQTGTVNVANGSQISGEVISVNGKDIVIQIGPDQQLSARLAADMNVELGQLMSFEVQKGGNGQIALRALYANLDLNPTALKALDMANIPVRENTIAMVDAMMREGMSIDSESLQKMYHEIVKNPEAAGNTIVQLARLGIPVTNENIEQFQAYTNLEHQISGAVTEIGDYLMQASGAMFQSGDVSGAMGLQSLVLDLVAGSDVNWIEDFMEQYKAGEQPEKAGKSDGVKADVQTAGESIKAQENIAFEETNEQRAEVAQKGIASVLSGEEMKELISMADKLGITDEIVKGIANGDVSTKQFLSLVNQILGQMDAFGAAGEKEVMKHFLKSPVYEKLLCTQMKEEFSLKPEDVFSKEKVQQLYDKIQNKMATLSQNLQVFGKGAEPLAQSVNNLQNNLEFMQQINHMANYVQLPLKMNGQDTNGELYVYTNKKNLAKKDGNISAFLHLDMTHLGPVDVYVAMNSNHNVNTHFYLASDEMIDFIQEHLHILDERLEKRGYHMNASITQKDQGTPFCVMEEVKKNCKEDGSVSSKIAAYAFDVRA